MQTLEADGYRRLGLFENPFTVPESDSADVLGVKLAKRNASTALLGALYAPSEDAGTRAIIARKSEDIPGAYYVAALSGVFGRLSSGEFGTGLHAYVPIDMMRIGRVRAVLHMIAERVAGASADLTIAAWAESVFAANAESAEVRELLKSPDVADLIDLAATDPAAFSARVFGELAMSREGAEDVEMLMRLSAARLDRLGTDPDSSGDEVDAGDPMGEAFITQLGDVDEGALPESEEDDAARAVADYLLVKATELSPVLARALTAFSAQGAASMAEELKITKAPSKTLVALTHFARCRFEKIVVIFDRFDLFTIAPDDLKSDIGTSIAQMKSSLDGLVTFVFVLQPGIAPAVEASLADARTVDWSFESLALVDARDSVFPPALALKWIRDASVGSDVPAWALDLVQAVPDGSNAQAAFAALGTAIDAASTEHRMPVPADVLV